VARGGISRKAGGGVMKDMGHVHMLLFHAAFHCGKEEWVKGVPKKKSSRPGFFQVPFLPRAALISIGGGELEKKPGAAKEECPFLPLFWQSYVKSGKKGGAK